MEAKLWFKQKGDIARDEKGHSSNYQNKQYLLKDTSLKAKEWLGREGCHLLTLPGMSLNMYVTLKGP